MCKHTIVIGYPGGHAQLAWLVEEFPPPRKSPAEAGLSARVTPYGAGFDAGAGYHHGLRNAGRARNARSWVWLG